MSWLKNFEEIETVEEPKSRTRERAEVQAFARVQSFALELARRYDSLVYNAQAKELYIRVNFQDGKIHVVQQLSDGWDRFTLPVSLLYLDELEATMAVEEMARSKRKKEQDENLANRRRLVANVLRKNSKLTDGQIDDLLGKIK